MASVRRRGREWRASGSRSTMPMSNYFCHISNTQVPLPHSRVRRASCYSPLVTEKTWLLAVQCPGSHTHEYATPLICELRRNTACFGLLLGSLLFWNGKGVMRIHDVRVCCGDVCTYVLGCAHAWLIIMFRVRHICQ